jgi:hypothetical protein
VFNSVKNLLYIGFGIILFDLDNLLEIPQILLSASIFSVSEEEFYARAKHNIKVLLSEGVSPKAILRQGSLHFGEEFTQSVIDEYFSEKATQTKEEKLAKRRAKAAAKRAALQSFFNSDLYSVACSILGFDIKQKLKSLALNSKWIRIRNHPTVDPADFTMNFSTFDVEAYQDEKGNFVPYQLGIFSPDLGYKSFYGEGCVSDAVKFILAHNYNSSEVTFFAHNGGKFDFFFLLIFYVDAGVSAVSSLRCGDIPTHLLHIQGDIYYSKL